MRLATVVLFSVFLGRAFAQTGSISGTVVDLAGKPVANAVIQAENSATKATFKATTSAAGTFAFEQLPTGVYQLSSAAPGFNRFNQSGVVVMLDITLRIDLRFEDQQLNTLGDGREFFDDQDRARARPTGPTPRLPDGKPDLSGVWWYQRTVDAGKPEAKPWAEAIKKERAQGLSKNSPSTQCLPSGITMSNALTQVWRVLHVPTYLLMISEMDASSYRQVYIDGRDHPKDVNPTWNGHSIGRWEGETLVVDTVGFNDKFWLPDQYPHTEKIHIIERYRRPDLGHIETEYTIEDPDTFEKPWVIKRTAELAVQEDLREYICNENERDRAHLK